MAKKRKLLTKNKVPLGKNLFANAGYMNNGSNTISYNPGATNTGWEFDNNSNYLVSNLTNSLSNIEKANAAAQAISNANTGFSLATNSGSYAAQLANNMPELANAASSGVNGLGIATGIGGTALGLAGLALDSINSTKLNDASSYEQALKNLGNTTFKFNSANDVLNTINQLPTIEKVNWEDIRGQKASYLNRALSGASAVGSFMSMVPGVNLLSGAIGAGAGALFGLASAWGDNYNMKQKAKDKAKEINANIPNIYNSLQSNMNVGTNNMQSNLAIDILKNNAAYGGKFNKFSSGGPEEKEKSILESYASPESVGGAIAKGAVQVLDPTGISSWPDVYYSGKEFFENPSWENAGWFALNTLGAIPAIGKVSLPFKASKTAKLLNTVGDAGAVAKVAKYAEDVNRVIDTVPELIPVTKNAAKGTQDVTTKYLVDPFFDWIRPANKFDVVSTYRDLNHMVDISNATNSVSDIATNVKDAVDAANKKGFGGPLFNEFSNGITYINEGNSHEENPYEGVQVGVDPEGIPNLVEEGEVIWNDYVFSDRLKVPKEEKDKMKLHGNKDMTFADAAKEITKMSEEMPNDSIVKRTMELRLNQLMQEQEMVRQRKNNNKESNQYSFGGYKKYLERNGIAIGDNVTKDNYKEQDNFKDYKNYIQNRNYDIASLSMQAAPVFGSLAAVINDVAGGNKPDYTNVDKYEAAINKAYKPIGAKTLSDYIEYNPYDISFGLNKLAANQAASRRALANTTNNPAALRAAILASDYNYGNQIGEELRRAQEYNDANRKAVADFNRGTNQYNADALFRADQFNAQQATNKANALGQVAQWRDQIYNANRVEQSANLTGLLESTAGLGETFMNLKDRRWLMDKGILVTPEGKIIQLPTEETKVSQTKPPVTTTTTYSTPAYYAKTGPLYEDTEDNSYYTKNGPLKNGGKIKRIKNKRRLS